MAGLGTRIGYSEYPSALLDRKLEDRRIGQEEVRIHTRTALELAHMEAQLAQLTEHNSPGPMVSLAAGEGVDEERIPMPERRKKERRSGVDRRKAERSTGVKRRKADRRKSR